MRSCGWALIQSDWCHKERIFEHAESHQGCTHIEPCEDTARRGVTSQQAERPPKGPHLPTLRSRTSGLQDREKINVCCLSCPVRVILLRQLEQIDTEPHSSPHRAFLVNRHCASKPIGLFLFFSYYYNCLFAHLVQQALHIHSFLPPDNL